MSGTKSVVHWKIMEIRVEQTPIEDVFVLTPTVFEDERGFFMEEYRSDVLRDHGIDFVCAQENHSGSTRGVLRGLHFQWEPPMAKLQRVTHGAAFLVAVDIRTNSPTVGKWFGVEASADNRKQLYSPAGFARGFLILSDYAEVQYKCGGLYNKDGESGILWNDPTIGIDWPMSDPILSGKDAKAQTLDEWLLRPESGRFQK